MGNLPSPPPSPLTNRQLEGLENSMQTLTMQVQDFASTTLGLAAALETQHLQLCKLTASIPEPPHQILVQSQPSPHADSSVQHKHPPTKDVLVQHGPPPFFDVSIQHGPHPSIDASVQH